ncbi:hypothetical protein SNEBB_006874 [Seison nebaliae]|nr:hypothetical protein SNEBB_006874 [Seison nebaliae]
MKVLLIFAFYFLEIFDASLNAIVIQSDACYKAFKEHQLNLQVTLQHFINTYSWNETVDFRYQRYSNIISLEICKFEGIDIERIEFAFAPGRRENRPPQTINHTLFYYCLKEPLKLEVKYVQLSVQKVVHDPQYFSEKILLSLKDCKSDSWNSLNNLGIKENTNIRPIQIILYNLFGLIIYFLLVRIICMVNKKIRLKLQELHYHEKKNVPFFKKDPSLLMLAMKDIPTFDDSVVEKKEGEDYDDDDSLFEDDEDSDKGESEKANTAKDGLAKNEKVEMKPII